MQADTADRALCFPSSLARGLQDRGPEDKGRARIAARVAANESAVASQRVTAVALDSRTLVERDTQFLMAAAQMRREKLLWLLMPRGKAIASLFSRLASLCLPPSRGACVVKKIQRKFKSFAGTQRKRRLGRDSRIRKEEKESEGARGR